MDLPTLESIYHMADGDHCFWHHTIIVTVMIKVWGHNLSQNTKFCTILELLLHLKRTLSLFNFKDLHKLKLLSNVDVNVTTSVGGLETAVFNFYTFRYTKRSWVFLILLEYVKNLCSKTR